MFNTLAAKAVILIADTKVSVTAAIDTILNKMPTNLKHSMAKALTTEVELVLYGEGEIIELTEEVPEDNLGYHYGL